MYSDNQSAIHIEKNSAFHSNIKHIQLKYHFIRSVLDEELLKLEKIHTSQNPIDMLENLVTRELGFSWPSITNIKKINFPNPRFKE